MPPRCCWRPSRGALQLSRGPRAAEITPSYLSRNQPSVLQLSRGPRAAEIPRARVDARAEARASIEPRPESRGDSAAAADEIAELRLQLSRGPRAAEILQVVAEARSVGGASIEPRPESRGDFTAQAFDFLSRTASIEPRPESRGDYLDSRAHMYERMLQLSRGQRAAEMKRRCGNSAALSGELQLSRGP